MWHTAQPAHHQHGVLPAPSTVLESGWWVLDMDRPTPRGAPWKLSGEVGDAGRDEAPGVGLRFLGPEMGLLLRMR